jgi:hypothetical protein
VGPFDLAAVLGDAQRKESLAAGLRRYSRRSRDSTKRSSSS